MSSAHHKPQAGVDPGLAALLGRLWQRLCESLPADQQAELREASAAEQAVLERVARGGPVSVDTASTILTLALRFGVPVTGTAGEAAASTDELQRLRELLVEELRLREIPLPKPTGQSDAVPSPLRMLRMLLGRDMPGVLPVRAAPDSQADVQELDAAQIESALDPGAEAELEPLHFEPVDDGIADLDEGDVTAAGTRALQAKPGTERKPTTRRTAAGASGSAEPDAKTSRTSRRSRPIAAVKDADAQTSRTARTKKKG